MAKSPALNWDDEDAPPLQPEPYPTNAKANEPVVAPTVRAKPGGPLFGKWSAHLAYLQHREAECEEELSLIREDIQAVRKRAKESPDA